MLFGLWYIRIWSNPPIPAGSVLLLSVLSPRIGTFSFPSCPPGGTAASSFFGFWEGAAGFLLSLFWGHGPLSFIRWAVLLIADAVCCGRLWPFDCHAPPLLPRSWFRSEGLNAVSPRRRGLTFPCRKVSKGHQGSALDLGTAKGVGLGQMFQHRRLIGLSLCGPRSFVLNGFCAVP